MSVEAVKALKVAEVRPNGLATPSNLIFVDFQKRARIERDKIIPISNPEIIIVSVINPDQSSSKIIKFPAINPELDVKTESTIIKEIKSPETYNPKKREVSYIKDLKRKTRRFRRGSRCHQPGHEPKSCHRGESGCKGRTKMTLLQKSKRNKSGKENKITKRFQIKDSSTDNRKRKD